MNYLEYYGLTQEPFSNAPVGRFYYNSSQHSQALARLMFAASTMKGLAVLAGDIGTGKTTLARRMLDSLPETQYEAGLLVIIHSGITVGWLLRRIAVQLGVPDASAEKLTLLSQLYQRLVEIKESGRKAVVLIDEAQMLRSREIMEEFRGLLNMEAEESKLITFVLFGLPEIENNLRLDPPLRQRVAVKYRLEAFSAESTAAYIQHRLQLAGSKANPFSAEAMAQVHGFARGIPRLINTLCDNALFEGFILKADAVRPDMIRNIAVDLGLHEPDTAPPWGNETTPSSVGGPPQPGDPEQPLSSELATPASIAAKADEGRNRSE